MNPKGRPTLQPKTAFASWLDAHGITRKQAASDLAVAEKYMVALVRGTRVPAPSLAKRIERYTDGDVPLLVWYKDL